MRLSKNQVQKAIDSTEIAIFIANPFILLQVGGLNLMTSRAVYTQKLTGAYSEAIMFNPYFFNKVDLTCPKFLRVLFHELGHATGNHNRINRQGVSKYHARTERIAYIEELIAERTSQKLMSHFEIQDAAIKGCSASYIETFLKHIETNLELSEIEAYQIERDSDLAFDFILQNWFNETNAMQKAA